MCTHFLSGILCMFLSLLFFTYRRVRPSQPQLLQSHVQKKLTHAKRAQSVPRVYRKLFAASRSEYSVVSHPRRVREKSSNGSETKTKDPTYLYGIVCVRLLKVYWLVNVL